MTGYTKLFGSILASTIWEESKDTKILWITMLAMANKHGEVHASIPGLATMSRLTREEVDKALVDLMSPDPDSRTKTADGRRIQEIDGGWWIINHEKYRELMNSEERKQYLTIKKRESRSRQQKSTLSTSVNKCRGLGTMSTHAEATPAQEEPSSLPVSEEISRVLELWNGLPKPIQKVASLTDERKKSLKARLSDPWWKENYPLAIDRIRESKFCRGEVASHDGRKWKANFDFFIRPDSVAKAIEGKYDNEKEPACTV